MVNVNSQTRRGSTKTSVRLWYWLRLLSSCSFSAHHTAAAALSCASASLQRPLWTWTGRATTRLPPAARTCASMCVSWVRTGLSRLSRDTRWDGTIWILALTHESFWWKIINALKVYLFLSLTRTLRGKSLTYWEALAYKPLSRGSAFIISRTGPVALYCFVTEILLTRMRWTPSSGIPLAACWPPAPMTWH